MQALGGEDMGLDQRAQRRQSRGAGADMIGQRRKAQIDAFATKALALPVQRLMLPEIRFAALRVSNRIIANRLGPASPRGMGWNGAGGCVIASYSRQEKRSRTVWITFHVRGTTSSVSVTSSPSFDSLFEPRQGQDDGPAITTRSRGRCSGNGFRDIACVRRT